MLYGELEALERREKLHRKKTKAAREERSLLTIDSCSQLDTGFTGRPDTDMKAQDARTREKIRWRKGTKV